MEECCLEELVTTEEIVVFLYLTVHCPVSEYLSASSANNLKCWRNRFNVKFNSLYFRTSSVFKWLGDTDSQNNISRMLIAFNDQCERTRFLQTVNLPKGTSFSFGSLDSL